MLSAIARIESGRKTNFSKDTVPWPWVINVKGQGTFFNSKVEAVEQVKKLIRGGVRNIDIGCMQINYYYHGHQFTSISYMFDPQKNVEYGARFLKFLRQEHGSWTKAVGLYHSGNPKFQVPYKKKLYEIWQVERLKEPEIVTDLIKGKVLNKPDQSDKWNYGSRAPLFFFAQSPSKNTESQGTLPSKNPAIIQKGKTTNLPKSPDTALIDKPIFFNLDDEN